MQKTALDLGKWQAKIEAANAAKKAKTAKRNGKQKGRVIVEDSAKNAEKTAMREKSTEVAEMLAKVYGIDVYLYDSTVDESVADKNGWIDGDDNIHIDVSAGKNHGQTMLFTLSHELTHLIKKWSPEKYKAFADFLMEQYGEHGVDTHGMLAEQMAKLKGETEEDVQADIEDAYDEMIADACERMLTDSDAVEKLRMLNEKEPTIIQKIKEFIKGIMDNVRQLYKNLRPDSKEARALSEMTDVLEEAYRLFEDMAVDAAKTRQAAAKGKPTGEGGVRFSVRQSVKADDGKVYGSVVATETDIFKGYKPRDWGKPLKKFVAEELAGKQLTVFDENGDSHIVEFAKSGERVKKDGANNDRAVIGKLQQKKDRNSQLAVANAVELIEVSFFDSTNNEHTHQWLDENGWEFRKAYMMLPGGQIYEATLNIGKSADGRNILYDINKIHRVGVAENIAETSPVAEVPTSVNSGMISDSGGKVKYSKRDEIVALQSIGRKSVNEFTARDIEVTESLARRYFEEMGAKSPFFRTWFGDWRAYDKTTVTVADRNGKARGTRTNRDTGWSIQVSGKVFSESQHKATSNQKALPYLEYIDSIVENAVLLDSFSIGKAKSENSIMMHSFYALADIGNGVEVLKLYVEEMYDPNSPTTAKRAYQLQSIEKNGSLKVRSSGENLPSSISQATEISVADLVEYVKQSDTTYKPRGVNPVLLNSDGKPKVFYHGTGANFTEFKYDEMSSVEGSFFFAENKEDAQAYGRVMEVYLTAQNLADYDNQPSEFYRLRNKRNQVEWLKERGYDGWYADMDSDGWGEVSVFSSEQIKSVDNTGTFDSANPDIRYSKRQKEGAASVTTEGIAESFGITKPGDYVHVQKQVFSTLQAEGFFTDEGGRSRTDVNAQTGMEIVTTRKSINETFSVESYKHVSTRLRLAKLATIRSVPEIIRTGELIADNVSNEKKTSSNLKFAYFRKIMIVDGETVEVTLTVRKSDKNKFYVHHIRYKNSTGTTSAESRVGTAAASNSDADGVIVPQDEADVKLSKREKKPSVYELLGQVDDNSYTYDTLVSKPDMKVTTVDVANVPTNRADIVSRARQNAAKVGKFNTKDGSIGIHVDDTDTDVIIAKHSLTHSLGRNLKEKGAVTLQAGAILKNAIKINELIPKKAEADSSYVLIGAAKNSSGDFYVVRFVVNSFSSELTSMDVLYAINAKRESAVLNAPTITETPLRNTDSTVSIADLLSLVNKYYPDVLPEDVLRRMGHTERPAGDLGESVLYSRRDQKSGLDGDSRLYDIDDDPLNGYNGIRVSKAEYARVRAALLEKVRSDTEFPQYRALSVFNPKLGIDNQYYVYWISATEFNILGKGDKQIARFREIYKKRHTGREGGLHSSETYGIENTGRRDRDRSVDARQGRNVGRYDSLHGRYERYNSSESTENDGGIIPSQPIKYSKREKSDRQILIEAIETAIDDSDEYGAMQLSAIEEYKSHIKELDEKQVELTRVRREIRDMMFKEGPRDKKKYRELIEESKRLEREIYRYDKILLQLEGTSTIRELTYRRMTRSAQNKIGKLAG